MTIDQLNEIQEWLSPLRALNGCKWDVFHGDQLANPGNFVRVDLYARRKKSGIMLVFRCEERVEIEAMQKEFIPISATTVWEQICLRCL